MTGIEDLDSDRMFGIVHILLFIRFFFSPRPN